MVLSGGSPSVAAWKKLMALHARMCYLLLNGIRDATTCKMHDREKSRAFGFYFAADILQRLRKPSTLGLSRNAACVGTLMTSTLPVRLVKTWKELVDVESGLDTIREEWVFRGQSNGCWPLETSLDRVCKSFGVSGADILRLERKYVDEFKRFHSI